MLDLEPIQEHMERWDAHVAGRDRKPTPNPWVGYTRNLLAEVERLRSERDDSPPPADAALLALGNRELGEQLKRAEAERDELMEHLREALGLPDDRTLSWKQLVGATYQQRETMRKSRLERDAFAQYVERAEYAATVAFVEWSCDADEGDRFRDIYRFMLEPSKPRTLEDLAADVERARQWFEQELEKHGKKVTR